jgi:FdrA protein
MSAAVVNELRKGFYLDSVALMRLSREIAALPGVQAAALMMGSAANREILAAARLLAGPGRAAKGNDLIVAIRAETAARADEVLAEASRRLEAPRGGLGGNGARVRPHGLRAALANLPEANLALISVPGEFAAAEARKALERGLHVMIFSDNVTLEDERALKEAARERGLLVMGPDCGTAVLGGVALGFSNRVPRGGIGLIGASGTGMQEVMCLIARGGGGISQAIGVGGRDLSEAVGGITTLMALDALERDPATRGIVLISKPPAPAVAQKIAARTAASAKPVTLCLIGAEPVEPPEGARLAPTLKAAAEQALGGAAIGAGFDTQALANPVPASRRKVAGLFSGGTLCAEAQVVFRAAGEPVASNAPIPGVATLTEASTGHALIDLGADTYTRGRPHPMIDPGLRDEALAEALGDGATGVVLLDLVLGSGAHPDPAGHLARVLAGAPPDRPVVIASVTGTDQDPQVRRAQVQTLEAAGVLVAPSNADAAALALAHLGQGGGA